MADDAAARNAKTAAAVRHAPGRPPAARASARRAVNLFLIGVALSVAGSILANDIDRRREQARFNDRMAVLARRFERDMLMPLEILHGLAGLFEASDEVTHEEFRKFAEPALARHQNVSGLLWVPRIEDEERAALVERMRATAPDFDIRHGPAKQNVAAPRRDTYHPIVYIVPPRPAALGIDLSGADPSRGWLDKAYVSGVFITPRVELETADGTEAAVGAYVPARKSGEPIGVVVASFRMARFVDRVFTPDELQGVQLLIYDEDDEETSLLFTTGGEVDADAATGRYEQPLSLENRNWRLVFQGTERLGTGMPVAVMGAGTALSLVVALLFFLFVRMRSLDRGARQLGQYELLEVLGEGGMGTVYRARHMLLRRPTAVKVIRTEVAERGSMRERFEREVHAASQLVHPNNIVVYDYGNTPNGELYYAMEYIDGIDLHRLVERHGPMPANRVAHTLRLVCGALAEAHEHGIVHRDIKPANIMLSRCGGLYDFPKVLDFGLALTRAPDQREITLDGAVLGTPHFMAPEQGLGVDDLGPAADIYALGCVAYFLLTGHNLFEAPTVNELVGKHMTAKPVPVRLLADRDIAPELAALVMQCLEKEPGARPTTDELARGVAELAATWSNDDAAAWWRENIKEEDSVVASARNRLLTVRLEDRASTVDLDRTISYVDSSDA